MKYKTSMIPFDFEGYLFKIRKSIPDLSRELNIKPNSLWKMVRRGSIKPSLLRRIELQIGRTKNFIKRKEVKN